jgi:aerobic carbon-monoxide dehydrogenase large subunit
MPDTNLADPTMLKFGVGQPVPRREDPTLLQGQGKYTDDISLPGQAWCVMVRSPYAHGVIRGIATEAARAMPGVLGVYTAADMAGIRADAIGPAAQEQGRTPLINIERGPLAADKVRYVGDPVAFVVAETKAQAKDAAEAVELDIDSLPAVTEASAAAAPGAPQLYDHVPGNVVLDFRYGDAAKVGSLRLRRACHDAVHPQQPHRRLRDGAAQRDRRIRRGGRALHPARRQPGRLRPAQPDGGRHPQGPRPTSCAS